MNDATPHLERLSEQLNDIRKHLVTLERTNDAVAHLRQGFDALLEQSRAQTETTAQMAIVSVLSELTAVTELIGEESRQVGKILEQGERELTMQKAVYDDSIAKVAAERNERVAKLLAPAFAIIDHDGDDLIATRYAPVFKHLESYAAVFEDQVAEREDSIRTRLERVKASITDFAESRDRMLAAIESITFSCADGDAPEQLNVPWYVVHKRNRKTGEVRAELVAPGRLSPEEGPFSGPSVEPFAFLADRSERMGRHLAPTPPAGDSIDAARVMDGLPEPSGRFARRARRLLRGLLAGRAVTLGHDTVPMEGVDHE